MSKMQIREILGKYLDGNSVDFDLAITELLRLLKQNHKIFWSESASLLDKYRNENATAIDGIIACRVLFNKINSKYGE